MKVIIPTDSENPTFPDIDNISLFPNRGLKELTESDKISYQKRITNFKNLSNQQPQFFISKANWKRLLNGEIISRDGKVYRWLKEKYPNYEVYAFVFCIAQTYYGSVEFPSPIFYFRIRTIIRLKTELNLPPKLKPKNPQSHTIYSVPELEVDFIAYVDWRTGLGNTLDSPSPSNCLMFLDEGDEGIIKINTDVNFWKNDVGYGDSHNGRYDLHLQSKNSPKDFGWINGKKMTQEGAIFSKNRVEEILNQNPNSKGTKIDFALDFLEEAVANAKGKINPIKFVFNINPSFVTDELPCPIPTVC